MEGSSGRPHDGLDMEPEASSQNPVHDAGSGRLARHELLESRLNELEKLVRASSLVSSSRPMDPAMVGEPKSLPTEVSDPDFDDVEKHMMQLNNENTIPAVRKCDYQEFKNRFSEEDGLYAVDYLVSGNLLDQEMQEEHKFRQRQRDFQQMQSKTAKSKANAFMKLTSSTAIKAIKKAQGDHVWIRRIRLQSPVLLTILSKIQGETWSSRIRPYYRPFETLIYFHPKMKKVLSELEEKWGSHLGGNSGRATPLSMAGSTTTQDLAQAVNADGPVDDSPAALAILRAYVEFFDREVMPDYHQFERLDYRDDARVRFDDLWYLFRYGEIAYEPFEGDLSQEREYFAEKRIWRIYNIRPWDNTPDRQDEPIEHRKYDSVEQEMSHSALEVRAYYIDFNGEEFVSVTKTFIINRYAGLRPVTEFPIFPIRFVENSEELQRRSDDIGRKVIRYLKEKHGSYDSWTVTRTPSREPVTDENNVPVKHAMHITGDIMVDFTEAFQEVPHWKPTRSIIRPKPVDQKVALDELPVLWWTGPDRQTLLGETTELVPIRSGVNKWMRNKNVSEDDLLLKTMAENDSRRQLTTAKDIGPEDVGLVTGRIFAYVFQERKFAQLDIRGMLPSSRSVDALQNLKIPERKKDWIVQSVRGHLLQRAEEKNRGQRRPSQDIIQGKGSGLFILLHGVPGVGKTATAEAVAQANGKPLFKITCGDLGLTPDQVESSIRRIFRLASLWDCILLLDEVDTFFSQRSKGDAAINKNALVSVFLRILDYYNGILFLTTNRAGALDEAFKSRIHFKIYYPRLTREQTLDIWKVNIDRLKRIEEEQRDGSRRLLLDIPEEEILQFAAGQFERFTQNPRELVQWNGRQIRNAFQVTRSLAYADADAEFEYLTENGEDTRPAPRLDVKHFEWIETITDEFDKYMHSITGMSDSQLAAEAEHRADQWNDGPWVTPERTPPERTYDNHYSDHRESLGAPGYNPDMGMPYRGPSSGASRQGVHRMSTGASWPNTQGGPLSFARGTSPGASPWREGYEDRDPAPLPPSINTQDAPGYRASPSTGTGISQTRPPYQHHPSSGPQISVRRASRSPFESENTRRASSPPSPWGATTSSTRYGPRVTGRSPNV